jgi:magnesium-protoporphyrin IX monomethyl ester (oxidative) cyclase
MPPIFNILLVDSAEVIRTGFIPTGLCYLSAYLKKHLGEAVHVELITELPESVAELVALKPDLVGYSAFTHSFNITIAHAQQWRQLSPATPLVFGGQHISMAPWTLPPEFDYGILGEGEETFLELVRHAMANPLQPGLEISGTETWVQGNLVKAAPRQPIEPLDIIAYPDRSLVKDIESIITRPHINIFGQGQTRAMQVNTSRGCPHKCRFCQPSLLWGKYRMHSAAYIADELEIVLKDYNANAILFEDDLFSVSKKRVRDLIDLLKQKGLAHKAKYYVAARTSQIDEEWVEIYKELGVVRVEFGIESGNDDIAAYLKTGISDMATNKKAIRMLNQAGIGVYASFIAGSRPETPAQLKDTWKMMKWIRKSSYLNQSGINIATPLPGTDFWDDAVARKRIDPLTLDWKHLATLTRTPKSPDDIILLNEHMTAQDLIQRVRVIDFKLRLGTPIQFLIALPRRLNKLRKRILG